MLQFLREHKVLYAILILAVFFVSLWLIFSGQRITGSAAGLVRMLIGLAGLLGLLYLYNKPYASKKEPKNKPTGEQK